MIEVLPILLIFLSGYFFKLFKKDLSDPLVDFVLYFVFPVFIIHKIHYLEFDESIIVIILMGLLAFSLGLFYSFLAAKIFNLNKNTASMIAMSVAFGNTSFLGFAFVQTYYGDQGLSLAIFYDEIAVMLLLSIFAPIICSIGGNDSFSAKKVIKSMVTFPPMIAFVLAILSKLISFPQLIDLFMIKVSSILVPLVVFAVGMKFAISDIKGKSALIFLTLGIKMVAIPLSLYFVASTFMPIDLAVKVAIIESAMPPMILGTIIAVRAGLDKQLGLGSMGIGMILSFVSIPLIVEFLG